MTPKNYECSQTGLNACMKDLADCQAELARVLALRSEDKKAFDACRKLSWENKQRADQLEGELAKLVDRAPVIIWRGTIAATGAPIVEINEADLDGEHSLGNDPIGKGSTLEEAIVAIDDAMERSRK